MWWAGRPAEPLVASLCVELVGLHFGPSMATVYREIAMVPEILISKLPVTCQLSNSTVRDCLKSLWNVGVIDLFESGATTARALIPFSLDLLYYPLVKEAFEEVAGEAGGSLFSSFLVYGRFHRELLASEATAICKLGEDVVLQAFDKLVEAKLIIRSPKSDQVLIGLTESQLKAIDAQVTVPRKRARLAPVIIGGLQVPRADLGLEAVPTCPPVTPKYVESDGKRYWQIGWEAFIHRHKWSIVIHLVRLRYSENEVAVINALKEINVPIDESGISKPVGLDRISNDKNAITNLCNGPDPILRRGTNNDVHLLMAASLIHYRTLTIENIVFDRFGPTAFRLFRLLLGQMADQKKAAELCMTTAKAARGELFKMLESGFVHMQEVQRSSEYTSQRTFFLWTVNMSQTVSEIRTEILKTLLNAITKKKCVDDEKSIELLDVALERSMLLLITMDLPERNYRMQIRHELLRNGKIGLKKEKKMEMK